MPPDGTSSYARDAPGAAAAHTGLCALQSARWHSREQYRTAWHRAHKLLASSDAHPAAENPACATHSALSDSSLPSSSASSYRPVRALNDSTRARLPLCSGLATSRCTSKLASASGQQSRRVCSGRCGCLGRRRGANESLHVLQAACNLQRVGVGRSEYALLRCKRSKQHLLGLDVNALV